MELQEYELARQDNGRFELRREPLRVRWAFDGLILSDGHVARCAFECSMRAVDEPSERRMLQEVLLDGKRSVTADDVTTHFDRTLRASVARALEAKPVTEALSDAGRVIVLDVLKSAAHRVGFSCGVEILPPFHLELESPSLQEQRLRDVQRSLSERQATGQIEHLQRSAELLKQFQAIRQSSPELSSGQVLQQITPADRGSMLQALLLASSRQDSATNLWAVAGPYLVRIDARVAPPKTELIPLPPTLGPLRSVEPATVDGERVLLVGARGGFMRVRPGSPTEPALYSDPQIKSDLGFNGVAYWGKTNGFVGCHGDAGVVRWNADGVDEPHSRTGRDALRSSFPSAGSNASPRNLCILDADRIIFSFGNTLIGMDAAGTTYPIASASSAEVVAIVPEERHVVVVHEDGTVCSIDRTRLEVASKQRTGTRLVAAGALPWLGSTRLLLASADGPIQCVGLDDPLLTQYASVHGGSRVVTGSTDLVAAVSSDRQRLILWNTWDGKQPLTEIYVTGITRHRVADVAFA